MKRKLLAIALLFDALGISFHKGLDYLERCLLLSSTMKRKLLVLALLFGALGVCFQ